MISAESKNFLESLVEKSDKMYGNRITFLCMKINFMAFNKENINDYEIFNTANKIINPETRDVPPKDIFLFKASIVANLLLSNIGKFRSPRITNRIYEKYPDAIDRLVTYFRENLESEYEEDFFLKDICFALGHSVPCGVQIVEMNSYISIYKALRSIAKIENMKSILLFFKNGGAGRWFRIHTESRYLSEFNEKGFSECYVNISKLLNKNTNVKGMVGTSWLNDPQLEAISPRLFFVQEIPM